MTTDKRLLDIHELCDRYSFRKWTVRTLCSQRRIPFIKISRKVLFDVDQIENWISEHAQPVEEVPRG